MVVLEPSWLANVMASVVTVALRSTTRVPGQLHRDDLEHVWEGHRAVVRPVLLQLLHAYEVAFPARDRDGKFLGFSIVPAMLRDVPQPGSSSSEELLGEEQADGEQVCVC